MATDSYPETIDSLPVADPRLRLQAPLHRMGDRTPPEYQITEASHPELVAALKTYLHRAGVREEYDIAMIGDGSGQEKWGTVRFAQKRILVGDGFISHGSLELLRHVIAHEIGHVWKRNHPSATSPVPESSPLPAGFKQEIEADLIGICLTQDKSGGIEMMSNPDIRPKAITNTRPLEVRKDAMKDFDLGRCGEWVDWSPVETGAPFLYGKNPGDTDRVR